MTDPVVGRLTFTGVIGREPSTEELASVVSHYLMRLPEEVAQSVRLPRARRRRGTPSQSLPERLSARDHDRSGRGSSPYQARPRWSQPFLLLRRLRLGLADRGELTRKAIDRAGVILGSPLDPPRVLVLGDTPKDVAAAHSANAIAVGVASGHYGEAELREAGGDYVLGSLTEELPGIGEAAP